MLVVEVAGVRVEALVGDLTDQGVDAVVNAANTGLQHGGGVAGALARAGGPEVQASSDAWVEEHGPLVPGVAAVTPAGELPCRWLVHVAGPVYRESAGGENARLLATAVTAALAAAEGAGATSVALPAISAGTYGYPPDAACSVIVETVAAWARGGVRRVDLVRLVGLDAAMADRFVAALSRAVAGGS